MADTRKKKVSGKNRGKIKVIAVIIEVIVLLAVLAALYVALKMSKMDSGNKLEDTKTNELTETTKEVMKKYTTIAIFGLDNRSNGDFNQGNSDVIMLASINEETKEVKLVSVYRDTYLNITGDDGFNKANAAFAHGGVEQAVNMLNVNLDLDIDEYVIVDFNAVADAVDVLGGVEIEVTDQEAIAMYGHINEVAEVTGKEAHQLPGADTYNLDGVQATAYARVRQTAGDDFKRTERQRLVIQKMVEKALASDIGTIDRLADVALEDVKTSMTSKEVLGLAKDAFNYSLGENTGFPFDKTTMVMDKCGDSVIPLDLASNVEQLHAFLFESEMYSVTSSVQKISQEIVDATGLSTADIP